MPRAPSRRPRCRAYGFWGGDPFGSAEGARPGSFPQLWVAGGPIDVQAKGLDGLSLHHGSGEAAMGSCTVKGQGRAVLLTRRGTAVAATQLHPKAYSVSWGMGVADGQQVGYGTPVGSHLPAALLWSGSAESVVELWLNMDVSRPALWRGSAESFVDLTPKQYHGGSLSACARGFQIGEAIADKQAKFRHAALWAGSPADFVDLHSVVPAEDFNTSRASAIHIDGNRLRVAGEVGLKKGDVLHTQLAAVWEADLRG